MFITKTDLLTGIYPEILNAITRSDTNIADVCADTEDEVASYLSARYDTNAIFAATGAARNRAVLRICRDVALYHLHVASNPNTVPDIRAKRYDDAIAYLKAIQAEQVNIPGLPRLIAGKSNYVKFGGSPKRRY